MAITAFIKEPFKQPRRKRWVVQSPSNHTVYMLARHNVVIPRTVIMHFKERELSEGAATTKASTVKFLCYPAII